MLASPAISTAKLENNYQMMSHSAQNLDIQNLEEHGGEYIDPKVVDSQSSKIII